MNPVLSAVVASFPVFGSTVLLAKCVEAGLVLCPILFISTFKSIGATNLVTAPVV